MAKSNRLEDYQLFYMEIPASSDQDLQDIQIIDVNAGDEPKPASGLSDDQVARLSHDTLDHQPSQAQATNTRSQHQLFDN